MAAMVDTGQLEAKVKAMYRQVAQMPDASFHFELGESLAVRLGYAADRLATVPADALASFAGVGAFFDLADLAAGETVVDLGSGSGTDVSYAAGPGRSDRSRHRHRLHPGAVGESPVSRARGRHRQR
jgi:arsenite methyltransferase